MKPIYQLFLALVLLNIQMSFAQNGTLDPSFNGDGKVLTAFGDYNSAVQTMAIQKNGKILAGGSVFDRSGFSQLAFARYNNDGSLDAKFGNEGKVVSTFSDLKMSLKSMVLQSDGKIVGAGIIYNNYTNSQFFLTRYHKNGKLDKNFGIDGIIIMNSVNINSLTMQPDGKIIAAGFSFDESNRDFRLIRFNKNGKLDTSFGVNGIVSASIGDRDLGFDVALQSNGKIILSGTSHNASGTYNTDVVIIRYNKNGKLDTTFGTNGITLINNNDFDTVKAIKIQSDNKILIAGWSGSPNVFFIERLLSNGNIDTNFGINGIAVTNISISESEDNIAVQADGKIIIAGSIENAGGNDIALARYDAFGNIDTTFGNDGYIITPFSTVSKANTLKLQSDGCIVVGGEAGTTGGTYSPDFAVLRYKTELNDQNTEKTELLSNVEFNSQKNIFTAFPNPVNQFVNLSFNLNQSERLSIDLYDNSGRLIKNLQKEQSFQSGLNTQNFDLPVSLSKGIYFLKISNGTTTSAIKIVK